MSETIHYPVGSTMNNDEMNDILLYIDPYNEDPNIENDMNGTVIFFTKSGPHIWKYRGNGTWERIE